MGKMNVFVTRGFPGEGMERLKSQFNVDLNTGWIPPTREDYIKRVKDADILMIYGDTVDAEILANASRLKLIVDNWGGRNIDRSLTEASNIRVESPPNSYPWIVNGVADLVWGMIIAVGRRFMEGGAFIREGHFTHSEQSNHLLLGEGLEGRTVGILGAGHIGRAVAKRAAGFNVKLVYYDVMKNDEIESYGATIVDKETLFMEADYITVHLSDIDANRHFVGAEQFAMMKKNAIIVNTARGRIIDEKAMITALHNKQIAAAALEVYEFEPNVSEELKVMSNVLLLPHVGGALLKERAGNMTYMTDVCIKFQDSYQQKERNNDR